MHCTSLVEGWDPGPALAGRIVNPYFLSTAKVYGKLGTHEVVETVQTKEG